MVNDFIKVVQDTQTIIKLNRQCDWRNLFLWNTKNLPDYNFLDSWGDDCIAFRYKSTQFAMVYNGMDRFISLVYGDNTVRVHKSTIISPTMPHLENLFVDEEEDLFDMVVFEHEMWLKNDNV